MADPYGWVDNALATIHRAHWHRAVQPLDGLPGPVMTGQGQPLVNFASNDYLGLAGDPRLRAAAIAALQQYGTGSTGSRLLSGHRPLHQQLEQALADLKGTEAALVFSSGYLANIGTITALVGQRDLILSDQYNHASLINGAKLSGATVLNYRHCDPQHLQEQLTQHRTQYRRCLILTDSVFSMDGDLCPLPEILALADDFEAMVLVDEAHGTGVLGATGAGGVEQLGCRGRPLVQMGTLSKALGSLGGYVAGSATLIDLLRNRASSWIYTTALTPAATAAACQAIAIVQAEPERRDRLRAHQQTLAQGLDKVLADPSPQSPLERRLASASPILCIEVKAEVKAAGKNAAMVMALKRRLMAQGLLLSAVRPPTVPISRLRITLMATHTSEHLDQLLGALGEIVAGR
ncbi:MAG: 8-amino-7-oxononanoate synthase [Leptolyngbya sp. RL_3_1]|nr:8-amino-7-oxononanoate synthase [Leptolyngbya sp. RL_3_1]